MNMLCIFSHEVTLSNEVLVCNNIANDHINSPELASSRFQYSLKKVLLIPRMKNSRQLR